MKTGSGRGRRAVALVVACVLALVAAEAGLRVLAPEPPPMRWAHFEGFLGDTGRRLIAIARDDPELFWRIAPNVTMPEDAPSVFGRVSNAQGLRDDHEIPPKGPGELRVLFVGDSCVFGLGVAWDETVAELTEGLLRERFPELPVECVNAGVPGYTAFQVERYLAVRGLALEPDLVVLGTGWNERTVWDARSDVEELALRKARRPPAPLDRSRLCRLVWSALRGRGAARGDDPARERLTPDELTEVLGRIRALLAPRGVELFLIVPGGRGNADRSRTVRPVRAAHQRALYRFAERDDMRYLPQGAPARIDGAAIVLELAREHGPDELFSDSVHPTALTNAAMARALVDTLAPWVVERFDH